MARPLRLEMPGGRFHVTFRGNEQRPIFRQDTDRYRFLELLSELPERFGTRIHAYVLMDNHVHLLLETPEPNLSRAMQWLGVSYSMWFNTRHRRSGHLFQGRYKAFLVEDVRGWQELARYVHLNPVRVARLGLGKADRSASRMGVAPPPSPELVAKRLRVLREFPWSSYRGYAGYNQPLAWITRDPLRRVCGGRTEKEQRAALREYTEEPLRQGVLERPLDAVQMGTVLGTAEFARRVMGGIAGNRREQRALREGSQAVSWDRIIAALEREKGEAWKDFARRYGDWGRDAALWLGRRHGRLKLAELGRLTGGMDYAAVSLALRRFSQKLTKTPKLRRSIDRIELSLSTAEKESPARLLPLPRNSQASRL